MPAATATHTTRTHRRSSLPWISGWHFQAQEAPVGKFLSVMKTIWIGDKSRVWGLWKVESQPLVLMEAATALRTGNNCGGTDTVDKESLIWAVFTQAAGIWKGIDLDYEVFFFSLQKIGMMQEIWNLAFSLVIWTFTTVLVFILLHAYPLITFWREESRCKGPYHFKHHPSTHRWKCGRSSIDE